MGCDIHLYVEKLEDDEWVAVDKFEVVKEEGEEPYLHVDYQNQYYAGRNYSLFAILANVRNGYGFAGVDTGDGFVPIDMPRGIPDDASPEYKQIAGEWSGDGHSHSWLTVQELLDYDWMQSTKCRGVIDAASMYSWNKDGMANNGPDMYCGAVFGDNIKKENPNSAIVKRVEELVSKNTRGSSLHSLDFDPNDPDTAIMRYLSSRLEGWHTEAEWEETYWNSAGDFLDILPKLRELGDPSKVRITFFFDN